MPLARFFSPSASAGRPTVVLPADEAHHLTHVLRLRTGDEVGIFDGQGREWRGRVALIDKESVEIALSDEIAPAAEPAVRVTLGIGLLKGDQMDAVVRDATMLGVAEIAPLTTEHVSVPARAVKIERWQRVAVASAKQCRRAVVPHVRPLAAFADALEESISGVRIICVEPAAVFHATPRPLADLPPPDSAFLLIGPEGGWSAAEIDHALGQGAVPIGLGPRTLRAESAPIVALAALWTAWGW